MARRRGKCYCCPIERADILQPVEGHHVIPVEYGGPEDGTKVDICASCHDLVHAEAEHLAKTGSFEGELTNKQEILAKYILQAKLRFMASGKEKADSARNMMQVSFTKEELLIAHDLKKKLGFKSLPRMVKHLILEAYTKK